MFSLVRYFNAAKRPENIAALPLIDLDMMVKYFLPASAYNTALL